MAEIFRIRDPKTGLWMSGGPLRPTFKAKTQLSWSRRASARRVCTDYFIRKAGPAEYFANLPETIEIVRFEVVETEREAAPLDMETDPVAKVIGAFDRVLRADRRFRYEDDLRIFMRDTLDKKTYFRYFARTPWDYVMAESIEDKVRGSCIPRQHMRADGCCIALKTDADLVAARMFLDLEVVYDSKKERFLGD